MASGLPDYFSGVDIAYQALAQVTNRPKYGGAFLTGSVMTVTPSDDTDLIVVSGKGMIYGGLVWLDYTYSQANDEVIIQIDQYNLNDLSFLRLNNYNIQRDRTFPVTLNTYDPTNYIYSVGISFGITFETEVKVIYKETYGRDPTVFYRLVYALI